MLENQNALEGSGEVDDIVVGEGGEEEDLVAGCGEDGIVAGCGDDGLLVGGGADALGCDGEDNLVGGEDQQLDHSTLEEEISGEALDVEQSEEVYANQEVVQVFGGSRKRKLAVQGGKTKRKVSKKTEAAKKCPWPRYHKSKESLVKDKTVLNIPVLDSYGIPAKLQKKQQ